MYMAPEMARPLGQRLSPLTKQFARAAPPAIAPLPCNIASILLLAVAGSAGRARERPVQMASERHR